MKITNPLHPLYIKACRREARFWQGADDYASVTIPARVHAYENRHKTGDAFQDEFEYLRGMGKFLLGLSLGSGGGSYELKLLQDGIVDRFVFIDISEGALETLKHNAQALGLADRIETRIQDFNFLELPSDTYDLVSCQNMLHHIINLEECLHTINQSLTAGGIFVTNECVGENKMYRTDAKMGFIQAFQGVLQKHGIATKEYQRTNPTVLTNNCPFECVRSTDLLGVIEHYFLSHAVRHATYGHMQHMRNGLSDNTSDEYFDLLELFDTFVIKNELLQPNRLFGIYRKTTAPLLHTPARSDKEMKENIGVNAISEHGLMLRGEKMRRRFPRLYNALKHIYFKLR